MNWTKRMNKLYVPIVVGALLLHLLLAACTPPPCLAAYEDPPPEEAIPQATLIVIGTVESVIRKQEPMGSLETPEYAATVRVEQTVRGQTAAGESVIVRMICESHLKQGEYVLLLLVEQQPWGVRLVGGPQSVYHLTTDGQALNRLGAKNTQRDTTLTQLLALIASLPASPTAAATPMPGAVQPTETPATP